MEGFRLVYTSHYRMLLLTLPHARHTFHRTQLAPFLPSRARAGMSAHADNTGVLRLAADVVGNLASLDEGRLDAEAAGRALEAGQRRRARAGRVAAASSSSSIAGSALLSPTAAAAAADRPVST